MDAVLVLIVLLVLACALSVWTAALVRGVSGRLDAMESVVTNQGRALAGLAGASAASVSPVADAVPALDATALADANKVLADASPEDLAAATELLKKLGM